MKLKTILSGVSFLIVGLVAGVVISARMDVVAPAQSQNSTPETAVTKSGYSIEDAVINVADTAGKAVVSISSERTEKLQAPRRYYFRSPQGESPFGEGDPFSRFFDDFFGNLPDRSFKQKGLGSGVIIDAEGYILTNEHVVSGADKITVTLSDGRELKGEIRGRDARSDLAIIKVNARNLPTVSLGDSDNLKIGQWVVAVGNPFGFALENPEPTVTVGVISALHRTLGVMASRNGDYSDLIQTDAAINPGNSGGPLVNLKGEIVGINVAIFSTSGGYQGVGFAIPINSAKKIINRLIEGKKISYGWLGITIQDLNEELVSYFGLPDKNGILVAKVLENSPAQKAGMKEGDILKQFDNKPVNSTKELLSSVASTQVGKKVRVVFLRDKKQMSLEVEVAERPQDVDGEGGAPSNLETGAWRGLEVEELSEKSSRQFGLQGKKGVVIVAVEPGSLADEGGIVSGEMILEINKEPIENLADYDRATKKAKGDTLVRTSRGYFVVKAGE